MIKVNENTIPFQEGTRVKVLTECFDDAAMKAAVLRAVLTSLPGVGYLGASGQGGYGDNNAIRTQKIHDNVYIIGDGISAAGPGQGLMAPAHHQANQTLRILLGKD